MQPFASTPLRLRPLPRPGQLTYERRHERSDCAATALELALTRAALRGGLDAVLLVDDEGMVVATSITELDLTMLAAITPIVGRGKAIPRIRRNGERRDMSVEPLEVLGEQLYVAAVGGEPSIRRREVGFSIEATRRILA